MRALITGGAGFIGSHLAVRMLGEGHEVIVLDNLLHAPGYDKIACHRGSAGLRIVEGDVRDEERMTMLAGDVDFIVHAAAVINVDLAHVNPKMAVDINVNGTLSVLETCRKQDKSLLHLSSSEIYGSVLDGPHDENSPTNPPHPYGATKLAAEKLVTAYRKSYGLKALIARPFNCYGGGQSDRGYGAFISKSITRALTGEPVVVFGDGNQTRDYQYVDDLVDGLMLQIKAMEPGPLVFCSGVEHRIEDIAEYIAEKWGKSGVSYIAPRKGELPRLVGNPNLAKDRLGWEAKTEFYGDGLVRVWRSLAANQ